MVSTRCASSECQLGALREVVAREGHLKLSWSECLIGRRRSKRKRNVACSIGRVRTRFGEGRQARGVLISSTQESKARAGGIPGGKAEL